MCDCASCLWKHDDWKDVPTEDLKRLFRDAKAQGFAAAARLVESIPVVKQRYPRLSVQLNTCVQRGIERDGEIPELISLAGRGSSTPSGTSSTSSPAAPATGATCRSSP